MILGRPPTHLVFSGPLPRSRALVCVQAAKAKPRKPSGPQRQGGGGKRSGRRMQQQGGGAAAPMAEDGGGKRTVTIAIEGCCHGELDRIYDTLLGLEQREGRKIDLLICCGDFQAVRNLDDLETMSIPIKYRDIMTFWKYYSGQKVAPIPTLFVGGNHEAPNYLWELYHGGWAAPNIYFLGYAGVVKFGGLRIGGISGIYSEHHYRMGHFEAPPYSPSTLRSAYHVRELDVHRLMQVRGPIDVFVSHDWPQWITKHGDAEALFRKKPYFKAEALRGDLGSPPNQAILDELRPSYWFAAHLHCKFAAVVPHGANGAAAAADGGAFRLPGVGGGGGEAAAAGEQQQQQPQVTRFLSLDKCLPGRQFLQVVELEARGPLQLEYDEEWLAVLRSTHDLTSLDRAPPPLPHNWGGRAGPSQEDLEFIRTALQARGGPTVPNNFAPTAPAYSPAAGRRRGSQPMGAVRNPQTEQLFELIGRPYNLEHAAAGPGNAGRWGQQQQQQQQQPQQPPQWAVVVGGGAARAPTFVAAAAGAGGIVLPPAPPPPKNPEEIDIDESDEEGGAGTGNGNSTQQQQAAAAAAGGAAAGAAAQNPEEIDIDGEEDEKGGEEAGCRGPQGEGGGGGGSGGAGGGREDDPMFAPVELKSFGR